MRLQKLREQFANHFGPPYQLVDKTSILKSSEEDLKWIID